MIDPILSQLILFIVATAASEKLDRAEVAASIKEGDHDAFRRFFEEHNQQLYRFLRSKNINAAIAEDLIQQAFIYIWEHRSTINPTKSLRAYLFKISYTRMLNHIRDHKKFNDSELVPIQGTNHTPEDVTRANELDRAINTAINAMPEKRSRVFELCFIEQFTYKEAAQVLDVSVKTIENHMGLALKDIRKALQNFL